MDAGCKSGRGPARFQITASLWEAVEAISRTTTSVTCDVSNVNINSAAEFPVYTTINTKKKYK